VGRILERWHDVGRGVYMEKSAPTKLVCEMGEESYEYYPLGQYIVAAPGVCGCRPTFKYTRIDVHYVLERVMHVERSAMCMDAQRKRHPCVRRDPDPGGRLDSRVRGNDHHAVSAVCLHSRVHNTL